MASQTATVAGPQLPDRQVTESEARSLSGLRMLVLGVVLILAGIVLAVVASRLSHGAAVALVVVCILIFIVGSFVLAGLTPVVPGQARVVQLFGRYRGTIRDSGLQWVNPFTRRIAVSTRIRNQESAQAKVNDAEGNPIEIAAVVVWQVADTASAIYSVNDYTQFVTIQTETAVRHIASSYPYTSRREGELSLRDNADEITSRLSTEIAARVASAGVHIIESRLTRLSYAPEIAQGSCASSRPVPWSVPGSGSWKAPSAWSRWRCSDSKRRTWCSWMRSARPRWSPTCSWCCAASRPPSRWSTPAPSTSDGSARDYRHGTAVTERKSVLLRLDPAVHDALARWASNECTAPTPRSSSCSAARSPTQDGCRAGLDRCGPAGGRPPPAAPGAARHPGMTSPGDVMAWMRAGASSPAPPVNAQGRTGG